MINLLPPTIKAETSYAKRNAILVRYLRLLIIVILLVAVEFGGIEYYIAKQKKHYQDEITASSSQISSYRDLQTKAKAANARLKAFKSLVSGQTKFSVLLTDLANHTPQGVFINSISLTGNDRQAVKISATANSYAAAASLRDALATSSRIKDAAIENIANPSAGVFTVNITIAFKPGAFQ